MRAVIAAELLRLLRSPCFRVVLIGYVLLLTAGYIGCYSEFTTVTGVIPEAMTQLFGQRVFMSQTVLLTVLTPWVVSRTTRADHALVKLIALTALPPWQMVLGKLLATSIYLGQLLLLSLPVMILTHLLGAARPSDIVWGYTALFVWIMFVQLSTLCWALIVIASLPCLILSYMTLLPLSVMYVRLGSVLEEPLRSLALAFLNVCIGLLLRRYSNRNLIYLQEEI